MMKFHLSLHTLCIGHVAIDRYRVVAEGTAAYRAHSQHDGVPDRDRQLQSWKHLTG
jgi:hypothetical protein